MTLLRRLIAVVTFDLHPRPRDTTPAHITYVGSRSVRERRRRAKKALRTLDTPQGSTHRERASNEHHTA